MRQHEFPPGVPNTTVRCIYCGGLWQPTMTATCIDRPGIDPAPRRREPAMDDLDTIHARIQDLRREREAATNAPVC